MVTVSSANTRVVRDAVPPLRRWPGGCSIGSSTNLRRMSMRSVNIPGTELHQSGQRGLAWLCVSAMVLAVACFGNTADSVTERAATQLVPVGPVQAAITAGALFPDPPKVRVLDQYGGAFPGIDVVFEVTAGGGFMTATGLGFVSKQTVKTNLSGDASVLWQTGAAPGTNTLTVRVGNIAPVVFTATTTAAP